MITDDDISKVDIFLNDIIDRITFIEKYMSIPIDIELQEAMKHANKYMFDVKNILVGSMAHNMAIEYASNNKDSLEVQIDYDYYSTDPIKDCINIVNLLHSLNFEYLRAMNAMHKDTFTIAYKGKRIIDITYMPENIFEKLPRIKINNFYVIGPSIALIDMFRMSANAFANFRWPKALKRMKMMLKYFPITDDTNENIICNDFYGIQTNIDNMIEIIKTSSNYDVIFIGDYVASLYLNKNIVRTLDFYCIDYKNTVKNVVHKLKYLYRNKIVYHKYNAFYEFIPQHTVILLDNNPIIKIIDRNNTCYTNIIINNNRISTFFGNIAYYLSNKFYNYVFDKPVNIEQKIINDIVKARQKFLKHTKKSIFDGDHYFSEYQIDCIFPIISPKFEMILNKDSKFKYNPHKKIKEIKYKYQTNNGKLIT